MYAYLSLTSPKENGMITQIFLIKRRHESLDYTNKKNAHRKIKAVSLLMEQQRYTHVHFIQVVFLFNALFCEIKFGNKLIITF